jgi:CRP-like cAMP-binding protein
MTVDKSGSLGRAYQDGEYIVRQGDVADCMFVVQEGQVELVRDEDGVEMHLVLCGQGQFIGESTLFGGGVHMTHVRAVGPARLITINRKNLMRRIHEDPSLAFHIIEALSYRIQKLTVQLAQLNTGKDRP